MNEVAELNTSNVPAPSGMFSLAPKSLDEALRFADLLSQSDMVPKDYQKKAGNILVAVQWGAEIGLKPLQAMQNIAVINGRPSLWGDAVIALVRGSPLCEYVLESDDGKTATCRVKRRGEPEQIRTFSVDDAKTAGLSGKQGPWSTNPKRMRQMRARAFALRDVFPDVLKGMPIAEELMDYTEHTPAATAGNTAPVASDDLLDAARSHADRGGETFKEWWKSIDRASRYALKVEIDDLKARTERADAARTVEEEPKAEEPAADPWVADMERAEGEGQ